MSKMSDRERLADLETRQRRMADEVAQARSALRSKYARAVADHAVERMSKRSSAMSSPRSSGAAAIGALKALPDPAPAERAKA